jgi:hypothetical protein
LLAEKVSNCLKIGKSVRHVNLLSSTTKVTKFVNGLNSIPRLSWLHDASKCLMLTPLPIYFSVIDFRLLSMRFSIALRFY